MGEKRYYISIPWERGWVCMNKLFPDALRALADSEGWEVSEGEAVFEGGERAIILTPPGEQASFPDRLHAVLEAMWGEGWGAHIGERDDTSDENFILLLQAGQHEFDLGLILTPPEDPPDQGEKGGERVDSGNCRHNTGLYSNPCKKGHKDKVTTFPCDDWQPKLVTMKGAVK